MSDTKNILPERICPMCGRAFILAPFHAYRDKNTRISYCSWHCYNHRNDNKKADKRSKSVEKCTLSGEVIETYVSARAAAEVVGADPWYVRNACKTGTTYRGYLWRYKNDLP